MAQPQAYNREVDFTERDGDDTNHAGINAELDAAALSINQIRDNLALIQRDDGGLQNGIVTAESLAPSAFDAVLVEVNEAVQDAQTAAGSATLAATTAIDARDNAQAAQAAAETASNAASLNATTAATKAAEAAASATSAATSASTATTKASEASTSATNAAASATAAAGSATTASTQATNAANSATAAANSATAAATSATNAATSASTATTQAGIATTQASTATAAATAAAASFDAFDDRYLGSKTADPTTDNDGNPLITGALYFNSVAGEMRVWAGTFWKATGSSVGGTINTAKYTATAGQTTFAIVYDVGFVHVYLNGLKLESGVDFTANNGTSVVLATGAAAGDVVDMIAFGIFSVANTYTKAEVNAPAGASLVGFQQSGAGAVAMNVQSKLREFVSVRDFGAVGDGVADDTAAIQAALNSTNRMIYFPPGRYKTTSTLTINQDAILCGSGGWQDPVDGGLVSAIETSGDFDALQIKPSSYFGVLNMSRLLVRKVGGSTKTNVGLKAAAWAPHVVVETCMFENFDTGVDLFIGLAQLRSVNCRFNNVGFKVKGTSFTLLNCYANRNTTGYRILESTVYSALIGCASDGNTGNAYEFIGTTGPFNSGFLSTNSIVRMENCGAEECARYLYVDGSWNIELLSPTTAGMTGTPSFAHIESARQITFRGLGGIGARNWLYINPAKCTQDVVSIEGDFPPQNISVPGTPAYNNVPVAMFGEKTSVGTFALAKTRIPRLQANPKANDAGAGAGSHSYLYKGLFAAQAQSSNRIRLRVKVLGNGFGASARIRFSQIVFANGAGDAGGDIFLVANNVGGIATRATVTSANITVSQASAASPDGFTYRYFFIESSFNFAYLWDVSAACLFEQFQADMFSIYNNWTVTNADVTTTGSISSGAPTLTVASGAGITDGMQILVNGAGAAGAVLITTVVSGGGTTTLTLANNASTTVSGAAVSAYTL